eukprot:350060-Chlamydomonas_euryale.AAC.2
MPYPCIYPPVRLSTVRLSVRPSTVRPPVCPSIRLSICLSILFVSASYTPHPTLKAYTSHTRPTPPTPALHLPHPPPKAFASCHRPQLHAHACTNETRFAHPASHTCPTPHARCTTHSRLPTQRGTASARAQRTF